MIAMAAARKVDEADDVHICFPSKGVFRDALNIANEKLI